MTPDTWRVIITVLLSIISVLLGLVYRDFIHRLSRVERKLSAIGLALVAIIIKMNPIPEEVVTALQEVLK